MPRPCLFVLAAGLALARPAVAEAPATDALAARLDELLGRPGGLTADEAAKRAASTSWDVRAREADRLAAAEAVDQAFAAFFPHLGLLGRYTRLSPITQPSLVGAASNVNLVFTDQSMPGAPVTPGHAFSTGPVSFTFPVFLNNTTLQATLTLPLSDYVLRLSQGLAATRHSDAAARISEAAARLAAAANARILFYQWVRARLQTLVVEEAKVQAEAHLRDVQNLFGAGLVSKADVLRVESQVASAELAIVRSRNLGVVLEEQLRAAMHDDTGRPFEIGEDVRLPAPAADTRDTDSLVEEAGKSRLEVRSLDESKASLEAQARVARAGAYPRLDGFGDIVYANPNQRIIPQVDEFRMTWDVGVTLSWSPNDTFQALPQSRALDAQAVRVAAQKGQLLDGLRVEVAQAATALHEADVALETSLRGLAAAEESYRSRRELFAAGKATSIELTDAENDLTRARLDTLGARVDQRIARVRVEHAIGEDVPK